MAVMRVAVDVTQPALAVRIENERIRHQALDAVPLAANDLYWRLPTAKAVSTASAVHEAVAECLHSLGC